MDCDLDWNWYVFLDVLRFLIEFFAKQSNVYPPLQNVSINITMLGPTWGGRTCPRAGPRGGDGEAFPAGMYMRTVPITLETPLPAMIDMGASKLCLGRVPKFRLLVPSSDCR